MPAMKFTTDHEWLRLTSEREGEMGITDHAQNELGELVFVELPEVGEEFEQGAELAVVESVKAAGEVTAPVDCVVQAVNSALLDEPTTVNEDALGLGWIVRISIEDPAQVSELMDEAAYNKFVAGS